MFPDFRLETYMARWEFTARYHLTASDAESMTLSELLSLASSEEREAFLRLRLGYTETRGGPELRAAIAATYACRSADDILCFAGAEEGIYATLTTLLAPGDHAIVVLPAYQSLETIPQSICATAAVPLELRDGWQLDLDRIRQAMRPETRAVIINFPNNPTGALLSDDDLDQLVALCASRGVWLFSDEAYRPLGPTGGRQSPQVADLYERGVSLGVMSKAYGLPGLRLGWIACRDRRLLEAVEKTKHYLSICNSVPSEHLAAIALRARERILERNRGIVADGLRAWARFFARHSALFDWTPPVAGCVSYPRLNGPDDVEAFCASLVREAGVLLLPASIFSSSLCELPSNHFRIGAGRLGLEDGLAAFDEFLERRGL